MLGSAAVWRWRRSVNVLPAVSTWGVGMRKGVMAVGVLLSWLVIAAGPPGFAQLPPPPPPPPALDKLDPLLQPRALSGTGTSRVIVRASTAATVGAVAALVQQVGGTLGRDLPILEAQV